MPEHRSDKPAEFCQTPDRIAAYLSDRIPNTLIFGQIGCQTICQIECQIECRNICQIECQITCWNKCVKSTVRKNCQIECQKKNRLECPLECQNRYVRCQIEFQLAGIARKKNAKIAVKTFPGSMPWKYDNRLGKSWQVAGRFRPRKLPICNLLPAGALCG